MDSFFICSPRLERFSIDDFLDKAPPGGGLLGDGHRVAVRRGFLAAPRMRGALAAQLRSRASPPMHDFIYRARRVRHDDLIVLCYINCCESRIHICPERSRDTSARYARRGTRALAPVPLTLLRGSIEFGRARLARRAPQGQRSERGLLGDIPSAVYYTQASFPSKRQKSRSRRGDFPLILSNEISSLDCHSRARWNSKIRAREIQYRS